MKELDITIGSTYTYFDNGNLSRCYDVVITKIVPFNEIDESTYELWKEEIDDCPKLYSNETDYFIFGELEFSEEVVFVRTTDGGWFSLDLWGGRLITDL